MKLDLMLPWFENCVLPFIPEGERAMLVMDGFTGHMSLEFLRRLRDLGFMLVLRYPHSSHKTQVCTSCICIVLS
jgi:hypothetical protein